MPTSPDIIEDPYPYQSLLGFRIIEWTSDVCVLHLPMHEKLRNRQGLPHGGVHATLLDTVMGYAGCYTGSAADKCYAMTLSMTVNYLSRPKGFLLIATGRKTGGGRKVYFAEARIEDETGELIATSTGTFRYRSGV